MHPQTHQNNGTVLATGDTYIFCSSTYSAIVTTKLWFILHFVCYLFCTALLCSPSYAIPILQCFSLCVVVYIPFHSMCHAACSLFCTASFLSLCCTVILCIDQFDSLWLCKPFSAHSHPAQTSKFFTGCAVNVMLTHALHWSVHTIFGHKWIPPRALLSNDFPITPIQLSFMIALRLSHKKKINRPKTFSYCISSDIYGCVHHLVTLNAKRGGCTRVSVSWVQLSVSIKICDMCIAQRHFLLQSVKLKTFWINLWSPRIWKQNGKP